MNSKEKAITEQVNVAAGDSVVKEAAAAHWGGYVGYFSGPDGYLGKVASSS